jgi:hypothetical protein
VTAAPPSLAGADHDNVSFPEDALATGDWGAEGGVGDGGGGGGDPEGRNAMSWPTFVADFAAVAVRGPVGPAVPSSWSPSSASTLALPLTVISARSTIPTAGVIVVDVAIPPARMSTPLGAAVVTDGTVIDELVAVAELLASTGVAVSTPT